MTTSRSDGRTLADRVWPKVDKWAGPQACWEWQGTLNEHGYGVIYARWLKAEKRSQMLLAHRAVWELTNGPIPEGKVLCHRCNNRRCVNPDHIYVGTMADNMADAGRAGTLSRDVRGERNPARRLTWAAVRQIRALHRPGNIAQLAREFGVDRTTVSLVVLGKTWKESDA